MRLLVGAESIWCGSPCLSCQVCYLVYSFLWGTDMIVATIRKNSMIHNLWWRQGLTFAALHGTRFVRKGAMYQSVGEIADLAALQRHSDVLLEVFGNVTLSTPARIVETVDDAVKQVAEERSAHKLEKPEVKVPEVPTLPANFVRRGRPPKSG